jgi:hypothetical protein
MMPAAGFSREHFFDRGGIQMPAREPSLQFSVMCLEVSEEAGPPTFRHLFYELPLPNFPFQMPQFYVANGWANGCGSFQQSVKILAPDKMKTIVETGEQSFVLGDPYTPFMSITAFNDLQFAEPGIYWVRVSLNEKIFLEYPLPVRRADGEKERATKEVGSCDRP